MKLVNYQPARVLAALGAFCQTVIILIAAVADWAPSLILPVEGVGTALMALLGSIFVEAKAVSREALNDYKAAVDAAHARG